MCDGSGVGQLCALSHWVSNIDRLARFYTRPTLNNVRSENHSKQSAVADGGVSLELSPVNTTTIERRALGDVVHGLATLPDEVTTHKRAALAELTGGEKRAVSKDTPIAECATRECRAVVNFTISHNLHHEYYL